MGKLLKLL